MILKMIYDDKIKMSTNDIENLINSVDLANFKPSISDERTIHLEVENGLDIKALDNAVSKWTVTTCAPHLSYSIFPLTTNSYLLKV